jgi:glycosyltransferase involved in cell wall biosynthesis
MRIVHVISSLDPKAGGPPAVAAQLSSAMATAGHEVTLVSHPHREAPDRMPSWFAWAPGSEKVRMLILPQFHAGGYLGIGPSTEILKSAIEAADAVHLHGVWEPLLWCAARQARASGVPYVVRPAGMLDPWSLRQKWLKKSLALALGFRRMLEGSAFIHTLNRDERDLVGLLGLTTRCEVVPNGVFLESIGSTPAPGKFRARHPALAGGDPFVLFLSRLHHKKGLDHLADAFQMLAGRLPNVKLVVAGPREDNSIDDFDDRIRRYNLADRVLKVGPLYAEQKFEAISDATVFCLPSRQEGFSVAVIEALALGLPAVISEPCHFPEVEECGAGRVVRLEPKLVGEALLQIVSSPETRARMSVAATKLVQSGYTWPRIAGRCVELYEQCRRKRRGMVPARGAGLVVEDGPLRILHAVASLDPATGGPPVVATKLATAQARDGHDVHLLAYNEPDALADIRAYMSEIPDAGKIEQHRLPERSDLERLTGSAAARLARSLVRTFDVVHLHGVWEVLLLRLAAEARACGVPYVVAPHGMLDPWSLKQRAFKKSMALRYSHRRLLSGAAFLHVLNHDEHRLMAPLRLSCPAEVIPNGVFPEEVLNLPPRGMFRAAHPELGSDPYVLFLSRLHYKKGLDFLGESFAIVSRRLPNLRLVVAGPDGGARAEFEAQIAASSVADRVHLVGPVYGRMKIAAVVDAAAFCLPSRQEGFSMAITEALGVGCPCVVSRECHYPEVAEAGAGRVVPLDSPVIADALEQVLRDDRDREKMGEAGRALVLERFTWPAIARRTVAAYLRYGVGNARP